MDKQYSYYAKVFKAFCDENRLRIIKMLKGSEKCACKILDELDIAQSTLSHHMKIMIQSGIVESRKEGKWTYYSLSDQGCYVAKKILDEFITKDKDYHSDCLCGIKEKEGVL